MSTVLGIDTGGTFTDGVIVDLDTKRILGAVKSPTTHRDLMIGIRKTIKQLSKYDLKTVSYIAISTTLATNAIVENRGCRVGLLLLGYEADQMLPQCEYCTLPGKFNIRGEETEPLDLDKTRHVIKSLQDKVDSIAISGICSVRNQQHEETVKRMVHEILGIPVVSAHELSAALGIQERTVTCVLNARLVFVIDSLLNAVNQVLSECGLDIPIMVVKGDGTLMNETITRERPIETILSGPAASIIGATYLNGSTDGLVLDMGGTTTDIAILKNGLPRLDKEGAKVGGWKTRVSAVEVTTSGLGGDSRIYLSSENVIEIGPCRNWPVSVICGKYPEYVDELKYELNHPAGLVGYEQFEGYFLLRQPSLHMELSDTQQKIVTVLANGPHTVCEVGRRIGMDPSLISFDSLLDYGILGAVGFTPTDILCLEGLYDAGNCEGSIIAENMLAKKCGLTAEGFISKAKAQITEKMCRVILDSALTYEKIDIDPFSKEKTMEYFFHSAVYHTEDALFSNTFRLGLPIIGIGAPTRFWLPPAAEKFHTEAILPDYNDVANAVGAAAGKVMSMCHIVVQNHETNGVYIYSTWGQIHLKPAVNNADDVMGRGVLLAIAKGKEIIMAEMKKQNIEKYDILVERKDIKAKISDGYELCIETKLDLIAVGHMNSIHQGMKQKSLLGAFWGKGKTPDFSKIPSVT